MNFILLVAALVLTLGFALYVYLSWRNIHKPLDGVILNYNRNCSLAVWFMIDLIGWAIWFTVLLAIFINAS